MQITVELKNVRVQYTPNHPFHKFRASFDEAPNIVGAGNSQPEAIGELFRQLAPQFGMTIRYS
jgi:hypothetical protein